MSVKCNVLKSGMCEITQKFGGSNNHRGLDLVGGGYTIDDIVAYDNGTVVLVTNGYGNGKGEGVNWRYGNFVKILHDDGTVTLYAHMEYTTVKYNQRVSKGQVIGRMGNSGNSSGGHLHWEFWKNNVYANNIDPMPYLSPKEEVILAKPVERDTNKRQFQVDYNDNLRVRNGVGTDKEVYGILNQGIYDFYDEYQAEGMIWVNIKDNQWCACTNMSRILEVEHNDPVVDTNTQDVDYKLEYFNVCNLMENLKERYESNEKEITQLLYQIDKLKEEKESFSNLKTFIAPESDNYYIHLEKDQKLEYRC